MHGGQADRRRAHAVEERFEPRLGVLVAVFFPELEQERRAFAVGKRSQVFLTSRVAVVLEQFGTVAWAGISGVAHQVAHQAYERQVNRFTQGVAQSRKATVVFLAEVMERVQTATGKKRLAGAGGIFTVQRGTEQGRQAAVFVLDQVVDDPTAEAVLLRHFDFLQIRDAHVAIFIVQLGDDLQVSGHYPHFCGGAQFQFAAFVDVERLVGAVGLYPHPRTVRGQLEQGEAVTHLGGAGGGQQAFAHQSDFGGIDRVGEFFQVGGGLTLQFTLQGAGGREVEAVEVVQRTVEQACQSTARNADAFVGFDRLHGRLGCPVAVGDFAGQCRSGERRIDHVVLGQQADVAVGEFGQFIAALGQVMGRAALGDHQREHFAQGQTFICQAFWIRRLAGQPFVGLVEIGSVPHAQTFGHAVHFSVPRHR
ncbi:hypothetical protein D3C85_836080 [compost metagenome]